MNYILGGGIAGLIWEYYHQDYKIITQNIGGQMASKFSLGPRLLHINSGTEKLLKELKLPTTKKQISVGYGFPVTTMFPMKGFRKQYYIKSRNIKDTDADNLEESVMTENKNYYSVYGIEMDTLATALAKEVNENNILQEQITKIDIQQKVIYTKTNKYKYDKIISTIPKNIFLELANISNDDLKSSNTTFVLTSYLKSLYIGYNYIYASNSEVPFHRMTKLDKEQLVFELSEKYNIEDLEKYFIREGLDIKIIDSVTIPNAQIITNNTISNIPDITFSGRYGTWNHGIKVEDVIQEAARNG